MGQAASHRERGWERFTDAAIAAVNAQAEPVVFMLWGSYAQKKAALVDSVDKGGRHLVLKAPHPCPLSAHSGFFGCRHFSKANALPGEPRACAPIDWALPAEGLAPASPPRRRRAGPPHRGRGRRRHRHGPGASLLLVRRDRLGLGDRGLVVDARLLAEQPRASASGLAPRIRAKKPSTLLRWSLTKASSRAASPRSSGL